jgi:glycosyltransferase involved in cell wall biosynthesis
MDKKCGNIKGRIMTGLSALVLTKNEKENINKCLKSLKFCNETVIIDDFSSDGTVEICIKHGVRVYERRLNGDFASQKNFGLSKCSGEWILSIDPDEVVPDELKNEIIKVVSDKSSSVNGYYLKRIDSLWGKKIKHSEFGEAKLLRLAKRGSGDWKRRVHEYWDVKGKTKELKNELLHNPHKNLSKFIENVNLFSKLHAKANYEDGKSSSLFKIIVWPAGKLIDNLFVKKGILDGERAFVASTMMSLHSFLSWSSLWLIQKRKDRQ